MGGKFLIDALLYSVRDGILVAEMGYGYAECDIMDDGRPPPRAGKVFVAIHGGGSRPGPANDRNLDELFSFSVTLTMRVTAPPDRIGTAQIARGGPGMLMTLARQQGFNAKVEQLRAYLHMNWGRVVLMNQTPPSANDNLQTWCADLGLAEVYGFVEPMRWSGGDPMPRLVGGEWFGSDPDSEEMGIVREMQFDGARRFQPQTATQGQFT